MLAFGGWGLALHGVFNMMQSSSRHSDSTKTQDTQKDWELLVVDLTDLSTIQNIVNEAKSLMFGDEERDVKYRMFPYPSFTVIDIALSHREWYINKESDTQEKEVIRHNSNTVDQIVFCSILIVLLKDHLLDLGEHILKSSDKQAN